MVEQAGQKWKGIGLLLLAVGTIVLALPDLKESWLLSRLHDRGLSATGRITSSSIDASGKWPVDVLHYEFQPLDGSPIQRGVERLSHGPMSGVSLLELPGKVYGGSLSVRYLSEAPGIHRLDVSLKGRSQSSLRMGVLFLLAGGIFAIWGVILWRRRMPIRNP